MGISHSMKTYTQKQYDNAKKRAYDKGYEARENLVTVDEAIMSATQIRDWKKWEQFDFDWTLIAIVVVFLGVILTIIIK